jgi:hypothetical protein
VTRAGAVKAGREAATRRAWPCQARARHYARWRRVSFVSFALLITGQSIRGELALGRVRIIASRPCIRWESSWIQTMMQPCASTAKFRDGGSNLDLGMKAIDMNGTPPPRIVIGSLSANGQHLPKLLQAHALFIVGELRPPGARRRRASPRLSPNATGQ